MTQMDLYLKTWCPWCIAAKKHLDERGYHYREFDVETDQAAAAQIQKISGQTKVPTLVVGKHILPDFGTDELDAFLQRHQIQP
jgi:glutaredoxin 3